MPEAQHGDTATHNIAHVTVCEWGSLVPKEPAVTASGSRRWAASFGGGREGEERGRHHSDEMHIYHCKSLERAACRRRRDEGRGGVDTAVHYGGRRGRSSWMQTESSQKCARPRIRQWQADRMSMALSATVPCFRGSTITRVVKQLQRLQRTVHMDGHISRTDSGYQRIMCSAVPHAEYACRMIQTSHQGA